MKYLSSASTADAALAADAPRSRLALDPDGHHESRQGRGRVSIVPRHPAAMKSTMVAMTLNRGSQGIA
jgi:hypothetical protein